MAMGAGSHINMASQQGFVAPCGTSSHTGGCGCFFIHNRAALLLLGLELACWGLQQALLRRVTLQGVAVRQREGEAGCTSS